MPLVAGGGRIALTPEALLRLAAGCGEAAAELARIRLQASSTAGSVGEALDLSGSLPEVERWLQEWAVDLLRRVRFLQAEASAGLVLTAVGLLKAVDQTTHGREAVRLHRQLRDAWSLYDRALAAGEFGRYGDLGSLGRWLAWQETVSSWGLPINWARAATHMGDEAIAAGKSVRFGKVAVEWTRVGHGTDILRGARWTRGLSKALGPIGFASDAIVLVRGSEYGGVRGRVDRAVAGVGLGSAGAAVAATALGLTAAPVVVTIAGGVAVGAAVWSVGNLTWDHRDDIARAVTSAAEWTGDRTEDAAGAIADAGEAAADLAGDVVDNVGDALTFWD